MTRLHRFPCGGMAIETTQEMGGINITECVGPLPDRFRMHYGSVTHPELPDGGGSNVGFDEFIAVLRSVSEDDAPAIVAGAIR